MHITGQCHCGAVSFRALVDPGRVLACHCADCQVFSGAPFRAVLPVPVGDISVTGSPRQYVKVADSGMPRVQAFCGECGTQLYACDAQNPSVLSLRLGCIKERAQLPPKVQIWTRSAMPWLHEMDEIPAHVQGLSSPRR